MNSDCTFQVDPLSIDKDDSKNPSSSMEYDSLTDPYWYTPYGFIRRLRYGRLVQLLVDNTTVTVGDVDSIVNIFALVDALVLTIPVAAITATKYSDWDNYQDLVNSCTSYPDGGTSVYEPSYYYNFQYELLANCALCSIYCTILSLILTVVYYLSRPSELNTKDISAKKLPHLPARRIGSSDESIEADINANFRIWWKRGRIMLLCILLATIAAVISLMFVVNVYYQTFFSFSDEFCSGTKSRVVKFTFGWMFTLTVFLLCFYIVI